MCCAGFVSSVSSQYPTVFTDTFNISAASKHVSRHICSSEALGFPQRVRCCISSSTLTLLRVDGDGGWAIKVIKWPLPRCLLLSHFHSLCPRWLRLPFCAVYLPPFFCFPPSISDCSALSAFVLHCLNEATLCTACWEAYVTAGQMF